jgi:hypothetical protein
MQKLNRSYLLYGTESYISVLEECTKSLRESRNFRVLIYLINSDKKINLENVYEGIVAGGGIINMHLLYIPTFLSIRCLPEEDKKEVKEIFENFKNWLWENYTKDNDFWNVNPYGWKRWQAVLDFMDAEDHSHLLPAFGEYIEKMDSVRKTDFKQIFPSLAHLT